MNKITLHRYPSGDPIQFTPRAIDVLATTHGGTTVVTKGKFKATVSESIDEINALIEQADKGVTK